ncbi:helix-turn-helix domain-containing protein [Listeria sp. PSOL-1]|uniref:helix-turn-helix domain-containing protein n=1 Tax=Listeria sp. PSOL-1 TaxID=1844999 RepID=UPI0013D80586|nr:helix-turn-helix domain-containing protein [Listeria sp. PSOL-1]
MNFFELQDLLEKDNVIIDYILVKCQYKEKYVKEHQRIKFEENKIYIQKSGYFQITYIENKEMKQISFKNTIWLGRFYHSKNNLIVEALTPATLIVLDTDEVFDLLEKDKLLAHLFFLLLAQIRGNFEMFELQFQFRPKERVVRLIKIISDKMNWATETEKELPRFFTMDFVAACCCCSRKVVSKALKELALEGILDISAKPWVILDPEKLDNYTTRLHLAAVNE